MLRIGRELDLAVAEQVMGSTVAFADDDTLTFKTLDGQYIDNWSPSTCMEDAMDVVRFFTKADGWRFTMSFMIVQAWTVCFTSPDGINYRGISMEDNPEEAICRAALKAFAGEK